MSEFNLEVDEASHFLRGLEGELEYYEINADASDPEISRLKSKVRAAKTHLLFLQERVKVKRESQKTDAEQSERDHSSDYASTLPAVTPDLSTYRPYERYWNPTQQSDESSSSSEDEKFADAKAKCLKNIEHTLHQLSPDIVLETTDPQKWVKFKIFNLTDLYKRLLKNPVIKEEE